MTTKSSKIKKLSVNLLKQSYNAMVNKIDNVLISGAIDIENWDEKNNPMILPKCIVTALLQNESNQYECKGTSFEKQIKKEVNNIKYFI